MAVKRTPARILHRNPASVVVSNDTLKFWLGMQVQKFVSLYGYDIYRCVDVSADFVKYITQHPASQFNRITIKAVRAIVVAGGINKEHSWVEITIGGEEFVVDVSGLKQFGIDFPVWPKTSYIRNLPKIMSDSRLRRRENSDYV